MYSGKEEKTVYLGVRAHRRARKVDYKNMSDTLWAQYRLENKLDTPTTTTPAFTTTSQKIQNSESIMNTVGNLSMEFLKFD